MSRGVPFDPKLATAGAILRGVDPATLLAGRSSLDRRRLELQFRLLQQGIARHTMIKVSLAGIVYDGNHGVRAAVDFGQSVDIVITDEPTTAHGPITEVSIEE